MKVHVAHSSGQFSDEKAQQVLDTERLCERAVEHNWWWLTGSEGGPASSLPYGFKTYAPRNQLRFHHKGGDVWIVSNDRHFTHRETEWYKVVDGRPNPGGFNDRGVLRLTGDTELGQITVLTAHYVTHGSPADGPEFSQRKGWNEDIAATIGSLGREYGKGKKLCFYGGDQNIQDRKFDTFLGAPFTSLADETGKHQSTGHGEIDVIASYNADGRVAGTSWKVYDDTEFRLASDHFLCEGVFEVTPLKVKP